MAIYFSAFGLKLPLTNKLLNFSVPKKRRKAVRKEESGDFNRFTGFPPELTAKDPSPHRHRTSLSTGDFSPVVFSAQSERDTMDHSDLDRQIELLRRCETIKESEVKALCSKAREILVEESNVQRVDSPVTVRRECNSVFLLSEITVMFLTFSIQIALHLV